MACNSCSKPYSLLKREKGCPSCGFSYCSNCLKYKLFIPKLNSEAKVCAKCNSVNENNVKTTTNLESPDAYYKRIAAVDNGVQINNSHRMGNSSNTDPSSSVDQEISNRLQKLKGPKQTVSVTTEEIANRLQNIKGDLPSTSDAELQQRLANLRGVPVSTLQSNPVSILPDNRTEQEQVDDLMKQYMEHAKIDGEYQEEFQGVIDDIQTRLQKLKNTHKTSGVAETKLSNLNVESEDDQDVLNKIIEKAKAESRLENDIGNAESDELPFCEICNEDAKMRCLGCKYLFCKQCFVEHKDEEDGCDRYEPYSPPKSFTE